MRRKSLHSFSSFFFSRLLAHIFSHLHIWIFYHHLVGSMRIYRLTLGKVEKSNQKEKKNHTHTPNPQSFLVLSHLPARIWCAPNVYIRSTHNGIPKVLVARPDDCDFRREREWEKKRSPTEKTARKNVIYWDSRYLRMANEPPPSVGTSIISSRWFFLSPFIRICICSMNWNRIRMVLFIAQFSVYFFSASFVRVYIRFNEYIFIFEFSTAVTRRYFFNVDLLTTSKL